MLSGVPGLERVLALDPMAARLTLASIVQASLPARKIRQTHTKTNDATRLHEGRLDMIGWPSCY